MAIKEVWITLTKDIDPNSNAHMQNAQNSFLSNATTSSGLAKAMLQKLDNINQAVKVLKTQKDKNAPQNK